MHYLLQALIAGIVVSAISLIGAILLLKEKWLDKILLYLVSFSAGAMLGSAFFHLLPEALLELNQPRVIFVYTLIGLVSFFILERVLRWRHCHEAGCPEHERKHLGYLNLVGDGVHNLIDGMVIVAAWAVNPAVGLAVSVSIALHEIPQEFSDLGVIMYAGFKKSQALLYNFLSALLSLMGVAIGYYLINNLNHINIFLLSFAAGNFIYIATTDLVPEIHKESRMKKTIGLFIIFLMALGLMFLAAE